MMSSGGLLRLSRAQFDATPDGSPQPLSFARIGSLDGLVPHPGNLRSSPSVASDKYGRLYFTTVDNVAIVDPGALAKSSMIPPIVIESVIVDNLAVDYAAANRFVEPSRLQFQYTSLNLRAPEYARFRYRLEGYDPAWIEAGTQRQVTYGTCTLVFTGSGSLVPAVRACGTRPARRSPFTSCPCSGARGGSS